MSLSYSSVNYKTTHFHLANIKEYLQTNISSSLAIHELSSELSSDRLSTINTALFHSSYFFDKMTCASNEIETVRYIYTAATDSNLNFIDSADSELTIGNDSLVQTFFSEQEDSNNNYLLTTVNLEKYFCFSHDSDDYIGILFPLGTNFNIIIIVQTYSDDSILVESSEITAKNLQYGFSTLQDENEIFLGSVQDPNTNFFEYAS